MKNVVKRIYGNIAKSKPGSCCGPTCCSTSNASASEKAGYSKDELQSIPKDANMGLGCGNPAALASLKEGETVVDLGSGGGIDAFLAARRVGEKGRVIGIDMTKEMIQKARLNAKKANIKNVKFALGDIEDIPLKDNTADCIISNCVINLAEDKQKVFNEAFRILKPAGRLMISDMVLLGELPATVLKSADMYAACIAGALKKSEYLGKIKKAGFTRIDVTKENAVRLSDYIGSDKIISGIAAGMSRNELEAVDKKVVSITVAARK